MVGCAEVPHRANVHADNIESCDLSKKSGDIRYSTPEVSDDYVLHFLEFDDQGWAYPTVDESGDARQGNASAQADCAISSLVSEAEKGEVLAIVFVHGWKHSAAYDDRDVQRFRKLLSNQSAHEKGRKTLGFYVAWNGASIDAPVLEEFSFWGRKNAAHHVSLGSVRGFFSRIKAVRNHYNSPAHPQGENCGAEWRGESQTCRLRTVMIGHSFGGQILFESAAPFVLETLSGVRDLPADTRPVSLPTRQQGIADLIILLNPAFEATRYDAVHRAAKFYNPGIYEPPLLVSITSSADNATRIAFPVARTINSIFQHPANSDLQSEAIRKTHGHMDYYRTHVLRKGGHPEEDARNAEGGPDRTGLCFDDGGQTPLAKRYRDRFVESSRDATGNVRLRKGWVRDYCGNLRLENRPDSDLGEHSIVWNVATDASIIPDHNTIGEIEVLNFVRQLYVDLSNSYKPPVPAKAD